MPTTSDSPESLAVGTTTDDGRHKVVSIGGRKVWARVEAEATNIAGIQSTINSLSERLTTARTELDAANAQIATNKQNIEALQSGTGGGDNTTAINALRTRVADAEAAIQAAQDSIGTVQTIANEAKAAADASTAATTNLSQQVSAIDTRANLIDNAIFTLSTKTNNIEASVTSLTADVTTLKDWRPTVDTKLASLQGQINQIDTSGGSGGSATFVRRNREWDLAHELTSDGLGSGGDDAAIINAFIAQKVQAGDRLIFTPPIISGVKKDYRITTSITIDRPLHLIGQGAGNTVINLSASTNASIAAFSAQSNDVEITGIEFFDPGGAGSAMKEQSGSSLPNFERWEFRDCFFNGTALRLRAIGAVLQDNTIATTGTRLAKYVDVIDCQFQGYLSDYTCEVRGNYGAHIDRCLFRDYGTSNTLGEGLKVLGGSENTRISHSKFMDGARDGVDIYDSVFSTIEGCEFERLGAVPIETKWNDGSPNECRGMRIIGNTFTECNFVQLSSHEILVQGNHHRRGKHDTGSSGIGLRVGPSNHDVNAHTRRAVVTDNLIEGSIQHGIQMTGVSYGVIAHNTIRNAGGYGINASPTYLTSIGNHVENPAAAAYNYTTAAGNTKVLGDTSI